MPNFYVLQTLLSHSLYHLFVVLHYYSSIILSNSKLKVSKLLGRLDYIKQVEIAMDPIHKYNNL